MNQELITISSDIRNKEWEFYTKTMDLRIYKGILQQRFQGSNGGETWENIEIIN
jgi:hypothetical protein